MTMPKVAGAAWFAGGAILIIGIMVMCGSPIDVLSRKTRERLAKYHADSTAFDSTMKAHALEAARQAILLAAEQARGDAQRRAADQFKRERLAADARAEAVSVIIAKLGDSLVAAVTLADSVPILVSTVAAQGHQIVALISSAAAGATESDSLRAQVSSLDRSLIAARQETAAEREAKEAALKRISDADAVVAGVEKDRKGFLKWQWLRSIHIVAGGGPGLTTEGHLDGVLFIGPAFNIWPKSR